MARPLTAEDVFLGFNRLWLGLAERRQVNHLEIPMEDGTRLFEEIRVFDAMLDGTFGLEREVHYFATIGRVTEYRADILADGVALSIAAAFIGRDAGGGRFHMDPEVLPAAEDAQLAAILTRLAACDWMPKEEQAAEILGALAPA